MTTRSLSLRRRQHVNTVVGYGENKLSSDPAAPQPPTTSRTARPGANSSSPFRLTGRDLGAEDTAASSNPDPSKRTAASRASPTGYALNKKSTGWSAFDRYCSDKGDSASDYGQPGKEGSMLQGLRGVKDFMVQTMANAKKKPGSGDQFVPHNNLDGRTTSSQRKREAGATTPHGPSIDDQHGAKRRKVQPDAKTYATVSSRFGVIQDGPNQIDPICIEDAGSHTDKQPSTNSFAQVNGKVGANVAEFRQVEKNVATPKSSGRPRKKTNSSIFGQRKPRLMTQSGMPPSDDDIFDSDSEVVERSSPASRAAVQSNRKSFVIELSPTGPSAGQGHVLSDPIHAPKRVAKRRSDDTDQDELSIDLNTHHAIKKRTPFSNSKSTRGSASISTRGDIRSSHFPDTVDTGPVDRGVFVRRAAGYKTGLYPAPQDSFDNDPEPTVVLRPGVVSTLLVPFDGHGTELDADWLRINLQRCLTISYNFDSPFVKITRSATHQTGTGALLVLECWDPDDAARLVGWAMKAMKRDTTLSIKFHIKEARQLKSVFDSTRKEVEQHLETNPGQPDSGLTKSAARLGQLWTPKVPNKPVETLAETRELPSHIDSGTKRANLRDGMKGVDGRGNNQSIDLERDSLSELRPRGIRRSDRISRALPRSPTPPQYESTWTEEHPDWAKDWRIPLSFHRTTVDKEDIARLDEGQFLNDSLLTFYLRYLHVTLEKENPTLAKRVYFHNSFFYAKLRPIKGRTINYEGVKTWTAKIDLLAHDFIVVPVNEYSHWWVAIICNAPRLLSHQTEVVDVDAEAESDTSNRAEANGRTENENTRKRTPTHGAEAQATRTDDLILDGQAPTTSSRTSPKTATMTKGMSKMSISPQKMTQPGPVFDLSGDDDTSCVAHTVPDSDDDLDLPVVSDIVRRPAMKPKKPTRKSAGPPPRKLDPKQPRIVTLDSLGSPHSVSVSFLKQYLLAEIKERKGIDLDDPGSLGTTAKDIPEQKNYCDCGVYLLGYIEAFIKDPDTFVRGILQREPPQWDVNAPKLRNRIRDIILDLQKSHQDEEEAENQAKAERKKQKKGRAASRGPGDPGSEAPGPVPDESSSRHISPASTPANSRVHSRRGTPRQPTATLVADGTPPDELQHPPQLDPASSMQRRPASASRRHDIAAIPVEDDSPTAVGASGVADETRTSHHILPHANAEDDDILPSIEDSGSAYARSG